MKATIPLVGGILLAGAACGAPPPVPSAAQGELVYRQCYACHALEPGANTPAGPTLHGIVGKRIAGEPDFNYSPALRRLAVEEESWTPELLDRFLADPSAVAPGTEMGLPGLADPEERRAVINWLRRARQAGQAIRETGVRSPRAETLAGTDSAFGRSAHGANAEEPVPTRSIAPMRSLPRG